MANITGDIKNEVLAQTIIDGWIISRHTKKIPYEPDSYLYIATKDGHRRICTQELQTVKKGIHKGREIQMNFGDNK